VNDKRAEVSKDPAERALEWLKRNQRTLIGFAAGLVIVASGVWFVLEYRGRKEVAAGQALEQARFATQSGNFALAASDLSRLIENYRGTRAGDEAVIMLAQVRLNQNQASQAADELRTALDGGLDPQFQSGAYSLLGVALENLGNLSDAGQAYEDAAAAAWYDELAAQYLNDAGRVHASAGNADRATVAYERLLRDYPDAQGATEAKLRLAELRAANVAARQ
jgi:predicted negative regulator of RcsB-dependent stress response